MEKEEREKIWMKFNGESNLTSDSRPASRLMTFERSLIGCKGFTS